MGIALLVILGIVALSLVGISGTLKRIEEHNKLFLPSPAPAEGADCTRCTNECSCSKPSEPSLEQTAPGD